MQLETVSFKIPYKNIKKGIKKERKIDRQIESIVKEIIEYPRQAKISHFTSTRVDISLQVTFKIEQTTKMTSFLILYSHCQYQKYL